MFRRYPDFSGSFNRLPPLRDFVTFTFAVIYIYLYFLYLFLNWLIERNFYRVCVLLFVFQISTQSVYEFYSYSKFQHNPSMSFIRIPDFNTICLWVIKLFHSVALAVELCVYFCLHFEYWLFSYLKENINKWYLKPNYMYIKPQNKEIKKVTFSS